MTLLRTLANEGTSICATIHSPSAYAFKLFDSVMMMLRGEVVYFGPAGESCAACCTVAGPLSVPPQVIPCTCEHQPGPLICQSQ